MSGIFGLNPLDDERLSCVCGEFYSPTRWCLLWQRGRLKPTAIRVRLPVSIIKPVANDLHVDEVRDRRSIDADRTLLVPLAKVLIF